MGMGERANQMRAETGKMQFGDDWQGLFIRGDDCLRIANTLKAPNAIMSIQSVIELFESSRADNPKSTQLMKEFSDCKK